MGTDNLEVPLYTVSSEDVREVIARSDELRSSVPELTEADMVAILGKSKDILDYDDVDVELLDSAIEGILRDEIEDGALGRTEIPVEYRDMQVMERMRLDERAHGTFSYDIDQVRDRFRETAGRDFDLTDEEADRLAEAVAEEIRADDGIWALCDGHFSSIVNEYAAALGKGRGPEGLDGLIDGYRDAADLERFDSPAEIVSDREGGEIQR